MRQFFPILDWITQYKKSYLAGDITAGLTVGVMLIPQGMAYAMLAGLPPIYGLYASTIPLIIYAIFGTSRQLAVGPVAMVALLISSGVGQLAAQGSPEFIQLAILLALIVGVIQFLMGFFKLGFLVNFLSHPVIAGFTSAAAVIIGFSQLKHLLGFNIPRGKVHETILAVINNYQDINIPTLTLGLVGILVLVILKRINRRIPGPLIAVVLGILAVYFLNLETSGVKIVKNVPDGLPPFHGLRWDFEKLSKLIPIALTIAFVGFMESIAVAKAIHAKYKDYKLIPNQELIGLGLANIIGSMFSSFPTTGGFSRTAVNDQAGARTGLAAIMSAFLIIITLLFFTSYFYFLPKAILAAIIMVAVYGLIDYKEAKHLWKTDRTDFWLFIITALGTLTLGIEEGIMIGVILSMSMLIYRVSYPHIAQLGKVPGTDLYRNIDRFDNLITDQSVAIMRFDAQLYFANINSFRNYIEELIEQRPNVKHILLDAKTINNIDSSAVHMLKDLIAELKQKEILFYMVDVKGPLRDVICRTELRPYIEEHIFVSISEALDYIKRNIEPQSDRYALQSVYE